MTKKEIVFKYLEDHKEATRIIKSLDMAACLDGIVNTIRRRHTKHIDYNEEQQQVAENIFKEINESLIEFSIDLDELLN